jgi:hypothetical protein
MTELWLNYTDENGSKRRVAVGSDRFVIGRQSDSDLPIPDSRLSRKHARIDRILDRFEIEDEGSSNGTDVNGEPVFDPVTLRDGDVLNFGGVEVRVEIVAAAATAAVAETPAVSVSTPAAKITPKAKPNADEGSSIPIGLILLAPILAVILVVCAGGIVYLVVSQNSTDVETSGTDTDSPAIDNDNDSDSPGGISKNADTLGDSNQGSTSKQVDNPTNSGVSADPGTTPTPANLSETAKVEINGAGFLRKIAQNDPKAFLTSEQAKRVGTKVKQYSNSSAIADNINSARKNAGQIKTLATSKNMKPQFLATAAIAKLGNSRGDVIQAAQSMADVLDKLSIQLGNEFAEDCLLTIAAFDQGAAGDTMKMRNMLQDLANKSTESSRTIRTIWFLQKQGKITPSEFDRAIAFLAIGTITQNPKDFGVNAEALNL